MRYLSIIIMFISLVSCTDTVVKNQVVSEYENKIDSILKEMSLEEKVNMIHASSSFTSGGVERLGIPELIMSDGPHGIRHEHGRDWSRDNITTDSVSYLPTGIALASTWNRELGYQYGKVLGNEAKARGKDVILGPGINIIRSPLCGRNFEYLSEDPFLTAEMAIGYIKGVQEQEVAACAKHYVANNQEKDRKLYNVEISERALREIYLPAFKASVQKADVYSVMGAYNKVWGQYTSHNEKLVNEILKEEYGFTGFLVSDWSAVQDTREALLYGTDIEMGTDLMMLPNPDYNRFYMADSTLAMVKRGEVDESVIDDKVRRILRIMHKTNHFGKKSTGKMNTSEHQQLALNVAEEGIVLLKNSGILPINPDKKQTIAVIGDNATRKHAEEGGSSQVKALYEITPLEGIRNSFGSEVEMKFARGYVPTRENVIDQKLLKEAVELARSADKVIFIGGWIHNVDAAVWDEASFDCESIDKKDLKLQFGQETVIREIAKVNRNLVVVIMGGSNVEMENWHDNSPAILQAWYPGMEGGNALANIIFGKTNPSGKLPMTFANSHLDYPSHSIGEFQSEDLNIHYKEGIMVGYRYFSSNTISPLYAFGHGLSYTHFKYSNLWIKKDRENVSIKLKVSNNGNYDGKEVVQCYISKPNSDMVRPLLELKAFTKIGIKKGETTEVELSIPMDALRVFDETRSEWVLEPGNYIIKLGASSEDIRLSNEFRI